MTPLPRSAPTACPDENALAGFASGELPAADVPVMEAHLDSCADCRALVAAVASESSVPEASTSEAPTRLDTGAPTLSEAGPQPVLPEGTRLGPYLLRKLAGAGGMGVVYAAEDPRLGRKVALKLLRPLRDGAEAEARARLLREAQAMARLSHPNVLPIFELGSEEGRDFLAMEWVDGTTLDGWLRERERPWREVLALLLAAGEGLAAAHRAGLVHRDFKPGNVLVGRDGRARVTDFGLARQGPVEEAPSLPEAHASGEPGLTRAGAVPGTPAYMSPEQRAGRPVDARSDQYSFCVTLHEALHGERPPRPDIGPSRVRRRTRTPRLPKHLRTALARGLATEPADRFPSMDALLAALSTPPRTRTLPLALATVLLGAGLGVLLWREAPAPVPATEEEQLQRAMAEAAKNGAQSVLLSMRVGETRELAVRDLARLAVGDPAIVELQAAPEGVKLTALASGATHVLTWDREGELRVYVVSVTLR